MNPDTAATKARNQLGRYLGLFAMQTTGAVIVLVNGAPVYQQFHRDFSGRERRPEVLWWAVAAVVLIQTGYWLRVRLQLSLPVSGHALFGHFAAFAARLNFIFASSTFALLFVAHHDELDLPPHRILMILALLFSLFCYTLELEHLSKTLQRVDIQA